MRLTARLDAAVEGPAQVWVALARDGLETEVGRGENGGRTLVNDAVVVALHPAGELAPGGRAQLDLSPPVPDLGSEGSLRVVAFVQDPRTLAVHGAVSASVD